MVTSDETEDHLYKKHEELCRAMNLDQQILTEAWDSFLNISSSYALEVCAALVSVVVGNNECDFFL